jgi:hypothetical protein
LIHTYHAVPLPCRSAKGLDCVFPIWFTQCGHVWFTHTMPFRSRSAKGLNCVCPIWFTQCGRVSFTHAMPSPCHPTNMPFWKRPLKATARSRKGDGMGTAWYVWIGLKGSRSFSQNTNVYRFFPPPYEYLRFFPVVIIPPRPHTHLSIIRWKENTAVTDRSTADASSQHPKNKKKTLK